MKFERKKMVNWYNVQQLAATGLKTIISSIFGNFADKREIQAALSEHCPFYYAEGDEIWVDYISDLGDGFNATYTMAHLMAQNQLPIQGKPLPRSKILIMGGDQVYPTPEKEEYQNRLQGPYNAAFPWDDTMSDHQRPHLFALPGNHDWYDGLGNFLKLFCQGRALGNWHTQQKRSYFALKLPHKYWIWGIDVQLNADIDKPQQDYFAEIVKNEMEDKDKIILCTAEPAWVYRSLDKQNESFNRLQFFINKHIYLKDTEEGRKNFRLIATLTGDFHHYSHYTIKDENNVKSNHLITAGGGGAFMHPTHMLKEHIRIDDDNYGLHAELESTYPSKKDAVRLSFLNLAFPLFNWTMTVFLGIFHLITAWFLQSTTQHPERDSFMEKLEKIDFSSENISQFLQILWETISHNPSIVLLNLILVLGIYAFTDVSTGKGKWNRIAGGLHSLLQLANFYLLMWIFSLINLRSLDLAVDAVAQFLLFTVEMIVLGGLLSGIIFGLYLLISTLVFQSHPTEAFSSFRWTGYKNFLRIHVSKEGVSIYPIGVKKVVKNWKNVGTEEKPRFEGDPIQYEMIEKNPIHIKNEIL